MVARPKLERKLMRRDRGLGEEEVTMGDSRLGNDEFRMANDE
jgi:hypothetical protein